MTPPSVSNQALHHASDWVSQDPDLEALRDHPRFVELFGRREG